MHGADEGNQGISLTTEQYDAIIALMPHIETVLKGKGVNPKRPDYDKADAVAEGGDDDGEDEEEVEKGDEDEGEGKKKKNFEDTSEDE